MSRFGSVVFLVLAAFGNWASAQGLHLPGISPVNLSMGGAATAAPIDSIGAVYWNAATISAMDNEMSLSVMDAMPNITASSSVAGLGAGSTDSNSGGALLPGFALVHRRPDSRWTMGLAAVSFAGAKVNFPSSTTNPIFTPPSNTPGAPGGLGALNASVEYTQFIFALSYAVSENLSIGFGPTVTASDISFSPLIVGGVNDADGSGQPRFATDNGHALHWGGGAQLGIYYIGDSNWNFGAAIKSEQWMEEAVWNSTDELGRPTVAKWHGEVPTIINVGTSYSGFENLLLALDIKYIDYSNASGCGDSGFGPPNAKVLGPGQDSVLAVSLGAQLRCSDCLYLRGGYTFNQRPQQEGETTESLFGPFFYQHTVHVGGSYQIGENVFLNGGYSLILPSTLTGQIDTPAGPVPGGSLSVDFYAHMATFGATVKY